MKFELVLNSDAEFELIYNALFGFKANAVEKGIQLPRASIHNALLSKFSNNITKFPSVVSMNRAYLVHLQNVLYNHILFVLLPESGKKESRDMISFLSDENSLHNRIYLKLVTLSENKNKLAAFVEAMSNS